MVRENYQGGQARPQGQRRPSQQGRQAARQGQGNASGRQSATRRYQDPYDDDDSYAVIHMTGASASQSRGQQGTRYQQGGQRQQRSPQRRPSNNTQAGGTQQATRRVPQGGQHQGNPQAQRQQGQPRRQQASQARGGRPQNQRPVVRPAGSTRIPITGGNPYSTTSGRPDAPTKKKGFVIPILVTLLVVLLLAGGAFGFMMLRKPKVTVKVNGQEVSVPKDSTLDEAKSQCEIKVTPGKLLAVDGSVIDEEGGTTQTVTVNGEELSEKEYGEFRFTANGTEVEFSDGVDETETFTSSEQSEPFVAHDAESSANDYWTGAIHLYQHGQDGVTTTKRGDTSGIEMTEQTAERKDEAFYIYSANTNGEKVVALTFDDGPWDESTDAILDVLEQYDAKATFFTIGNQVADHASQVQRERDLGCQVCTHSYDHASGSGQGVNLTYMSADEQVDEIENGYAALREILGEEPSHVIRAPGGNYYGSIVNVLKSHVDAEVGWDVDTEDWRKPGSSVIYERIMSAGPGNVVLMHDGGGDRSQTVEAVRQAVPDLIANGYRLVTLDEILAYGVPETAQAM